MHFEIARRKKERKTLRDCPNLDQVAPEVLLALNRLEQTFEVTRTEAIEVVPLDDLDENRRPIHQMLCEELQQVTTLVEVDQNIQTLQHLKVLVESQPRLLEPHLHAIVVCLGNLDELDTSSLQVRNVAHDVIRPQRDVLDTGTAVKVDVLFDL